MAQKKFTRMWVEENCNYYELLPIVNNYGLKMPWGIHANSCIAFAKEFHAEFYLDEEELKKFSEQGFDFYVDSGGLQKLKDKLNEQIPIVESQMKHLMNLDLSSLNNESLFQEYLDYVVPFGNLMRSYIITQPQFVVKIEQELRNILSSFSDSEDVYVKLTQPISEFIFSSKGEFFQKSFAELIGHEDSKINLDILSTPLYERRDRDLFEKKQFIKNNLISDHACKLGNILANIGEERLKMRFIWMPAVYLFELFLVELKRRYDIPKFLIRKYDCVEFEELIRFGRTISTSVLTERSRGFAKVLIDGEVKTLVGNKANEFIDSINKFDKHIKEIKGSIASRGFVRGRIIVLSYSESIEHKDKIEKMSKGDIIVSEMTRPNIIIACQKAGAIITDEGGITCHAAIVSRELGIPCIIGTKIATQVLKDGDMVEVDADNGVVRIIK